MADKTKPLGKGRRGRLRCTEPALVMLYRPGISPDRVGSVALSLSALDEKGVVVGRDGELFGSDVDQPELSGEHCRLRREGGGMRAGLRVEDLESTNGTWVLRRDKATGCLGDPVRVRGESAVLSEGDVVNAGRIFLQLTRVDIRANLPARHSVSLRGRHAVFRVADQAMGRLWRSMQEVALLESHTGQNGAGANRGGNRLKLVIFEGESGTGKEYLARSFAAMIPHRTGFVARSLARGEGGDPNLVANELFGHKKGAFYGADQDKRGAFSLASGGCLFLDELGHAPLDLQAQLLRAADPGMITPVGGNREQPVDVCLISATSDPVKQLVDDGRLLDTILGRANRVFSVPPLRQRPADILAIFLDQLHGPAPSTDSLHPALVSALLSARWPLNVRQLHNAAMEAHLSNREYDDKDIKLTDTVEAVLGMDVKLPQEGGDDDGGAGFRELDDDEKIRRVVEAYRRLPGNLAEAARSIDVTRPTLYRWLRRAEAKGLVKVVRKRPSTTRRRR